MLTLRKYYFKINNSLKLLRDGKRIGTSLLGNQEMRFMWNLAFCIAIAHHGASFRAYYTIRSFITFHGIFMAPGYGMGEDSVYGIELEELGEDSSVYEIEQEESQESVYGTGTSRYLAFWRN